MTTSFRPLRRWLTGSMRSPETFEGMDEEDIRIVLLIGLNAVYEGQATGETFNGIGRSDILIRVADKNIFIAECLVWDGEVKFRKKLEDQLLKYAVARHQSGFDRVLPR